MKIAEMTDHINYIHNLASESKFSDIDHYLIELTAIPSVDSYVLALRSSFPFRNELNNWDILLNEARLFIENQGEDVEKILIGLI